MTGSNASDYVLRQYALEVFVSSDLIWLTISNHAVRCRPNFRYR